MTSIAEGLFEATKVLAITQDQAWAIIHGFDAVKTVPDPAFSDDAYDPENFPEVEAHPEYYDIGFALREEFHPSEPDVDD